MKPLEKTKQGMKPPEKTDKGLAPPKKAKNQTKSIKSPKSHVLFKDQIFSGIEHVSKQKKSLPGNKDSKRSEFKDMGKRESEKSANSHVPQLHNEDLNDTESDQSDMSARCVDTQTQNSTKQDCLPNLIQSDDIIDNFKKSVSSGPYYVCSCCHQTWFRHSVVKTERLRAFDHHIIKECLTGVTSVNQSEWVCSTCNSYL